MTSSYCSMVEDGTGAYRTTMLISSPPLSGRWSLGHTTVWRGTVLPSEGSVGDRGTTAGRRCPYRRQAIRARRRQRARTGTRLPQLIGTWTLTGSRFWGGIGDFVRLCAVCPRVAGPGGPGSPWWLRLAVPERASARRLASSRRQPVENRSSGRRRHPPSREGDRTPARDGRRADAPLCVSGPWWWLLLREAQGPQDRLEGL